MKESEAQRDRRTQKKEQVVREEEEGQRTSERETLMAAWAPGLTGL